MVVGVGVGVRQANEALEGQCGMPLTKTRRALFIFNGALVCIALTRPSDSIALARIPRFSERVVAVPRGEAEHQLVQGGLCWPGAPWSGRPPRKIWRGGRRGARAERALRGTRAAAVRRPDPAGTTPNRGPAVRLSGTGLPIASGDISMIAPRQLRRPLESGYSTE